MSTENTDKLTEEVEETNSEVFADANIQTSSANELDENHIPVTQQLVLLAAILLLLLGGAVTPKIIALFDTSAEVTPAAPIKAEETVKPEALKPSIKPFKELNITAKSAYVWDVQEQRVLYKKDESQKLPIASITKLMTTLVAQEILDENSNVTIGDRAISQTGDSGLLQGETFQKQKLSDLVLMSSSNDGAFALAVAAGGLLANDDPANAFVHAMNIRAEELNLSNTSFRNPTGLDISRTEGGAYSSAKDMTFLMEYIVVNQPDILTFTQKNSARIYSKDGIYHEPVNTNYYIDEIPGLIGSKTGYTDLAGGNLVVAFDAGLNRPIIVTVLGSTRQERFTDVLTLVAESQKYVTQK